jgi:hypothetical protein
VRLRSVLLTISGGVQIWYEEEANLNCRRCVSLDRMPAGVENLRFVTDRSGSAASEAQRFSDGIMMKRCEDSGVVVW